MNKIIITQEQANAIERVKSVLKKETEVSFIFTYETLMDVLKNGYEVEKPKFEKGQVVKYESRYGQTEFGTFIKYEEITENEVCWAYWEGYKDEKYLLSKFVTLATPEESSKHKETMLWKSMNREFREILEGDKYQVKLTEEQIVMLKLSDKDIKNGNLNTHSQLDKSD